MTTKKLLTKGRAYVRTDGRWGGIIWYSDENGERKRKGFCASTKLEVTKKMSDYVAAFEQEIADADESTKTLRESMAKWLRLFKLPAVERTTYDHCEITTRRMIYPLLGDKIITDITAADIKNLLNTHMNAGYAHKTVKMAYCLLNEYFRYLTQQEIITRNPMSCVSMIRKTNFLAAQNKECLPDNERIVVFTPDEIEALKYEALRVDLDGKRVHRQAAAYLLMLNTGLRTGELLGLLNSDIDLEKRMMHIQRGVKLVTRREGLELGTGTELKVGNLKTASSRRDVPLNQTAIAMIKELRAEFYFGEDSPLVPDDNGEYTRPDVFRDRFYKTLRAAQIPIKGLHALRHTFATRLVNGIKQSDGSIKALSPRQVADILGHTTSQITEQYYVKKDTSRLNGATEGFEF